MATTPRTTLRPLLFLVLFLCLTVAAVHAQLQIPRQSKNPCHATKRTTGDGQETCDGVYVVPKKMCAKCSLKQWDTATGNFFNCRSIFGVTDAGCLEQLKKYAKANPCDTKRGTDVAVLSQPSHPDYNDAVDSTDYFIYSICETCCDCVPMMSKPNEYGQRKRSGTLLKADRGNCPAHARADVCKVWPDVKGVVNKKKNKKNISPLAQPICPRLRAWLEDIKTKGGWYNKPEVEMEEDLHFFLNNLTNTIGCKGKKTWKNCVRLESNQRRL